MHRDIAMSSLTLTQKLSQMHKKIVDLQCDLQEKKDNAEFLSEGDTSMKDIDIAHVGDKIHKIKGGFEEVAILTGQISDISFHEDANNNKSFKDKIMNSLDDVLVDTNAIIKQLRKTAKTQRFDRVHGEEKTVNDCQSPERVENIKTEFCEMLDSILRLIKESATARDSGFDSFNETTINKKECRLVTMEAFQCQDDCGAEGDITQAERLGELEICEKLAEKCKSRRRSNPGPIEHDETGQ